MGQFNYKISDDQLWNLSQFSTLIAHAYVLYLEPLSPWFSTRQSIFYYYFFFWRFANTLFQIYYTTKKNKKLGTTLPVGSQIGNFHIYHHNISAKQQVKAMLCETVAQKEHFKNIQCDSYMYSKWEEHEEKWNAMYQLCFSFFLGLNSIMGMVVYDNEFETKIKISHTCPLLRVITFCLYRWSLKTACSVL